MFLHFVFFNTLPRFQLRRQFGRTRPHSPRESSYNRRGTSAMDDFLSRMLPHSL